MKKKILLFAVIILIISSTSAFSWAIGGSFGIDPLGGLPMQVMLSVKPPSIPIVFGVGAQINQDLFNVGLTLDWWLYQSPLVGIISIYIGPGLYLAVPDPFELGGRIPVGLQIFPIDILELFLEITPALVFVSNRSGITIPQFALQGAVGFRFWF